MLAIIIDAIAGCRRLPRAISRRQEQARFDDWD